MVTRFAFKHSQPLLVSSLRSLGTKCIKQRTSSADLEEVWGGGYSFSNLLKDTFQPTPCFVALVLGRHSPRGGLKSPMAQRELKEKGRIFLCFWHPYRAWHRVNPQNTFVKQN